MDISEKLCHLETALPSVSSDIVVFCTHGTGGSSEEQYECWAAGWSVCFAAFPGSTRSGSSGNDAERPATPEADRFNAGMADKSGRESLVI